LSNLLGRGVIISVIIHIVLIGILSQQFDKTQNSADPKKIQKKKSIQSFLYTPAPRHKENTLDDTKQIKSNENYITPKNEKQSENRTDKQESKVVISPVSNPPPSTKHAPKNNSLDQKNIANKRSQLNRKITPERLRQQLNVLKNAQSFYNPPQNQENAHLPSIFNPAPTTVPKSTTRSEKQIEDDKKIRMTNYGGDISMNKGKNGNCSFTQDLSSVGMEGLSSTQHFKCGKSEFDENFSRHMKQAMDKYK